MSEVPAGASDGDEVAPQTVAAWQQGESRLYQAAMSGPETYQRSIHLVRRTVEHLRALGASSAVLLAADAQGAGLVPHAVGDDAESTLGIDLTLVAAAALALRHREVAAQQRARRRARELRAARERGETWVVLEVSGDADGDPFQPYRRLEVQVATGRALLVTAVADEQFRGCVHAVEALQLDVRTGSVQQARDVPVAATVHPGASAREQHVAALRERLSSS